MNKIEQAQQFAHQAHDSIKQVRKYSGQPYWTHTDKVAAIVASVGGTEDMVCAAHMHDILEDVYPLNPEYSPARISLLFGLPVASLVAELTDMYTKESYPKLNRKARHELENERLGKIAVEAKTIKLADLIDNTSSIVEHDKGFAKVYLKEKLALLPYLSEGNSDLLNRAALQTLAGFQALGMSIPTVTHI